ncbi:MAG: hypothetical protein AAGB11_20995 [Pseudomonadota bacterium]
MGIWHRGRKRAVMAGVVAGLWCATAAAQGVPRGQDYPTVVIADYVLACMKANGESRPLLERCACSIDVISTLLPYERYEEAEGFLSLGQIAGERGVIFRTSEQAKSAIEALRRAQVEAELRCF